MISEFVLTMAMSATAVPPGSVVNHGHPGHYTQPTTREYERFDTDYSRRLRYNDYVLNLDKAWKEYRNAGSTPAAFANYKKVARDLKRCYVWDDPYLTPVLPGTGLPGPYSATDASKGGGAGGDESGSCCGG